MRYVKTARLNLRLHEEDKEALKELGEELGMNMTDTIVYLIQKTYSQIGKKEKHNVQSTANGSMLQNN